MIKLFKKDETGDTLIEVMCAVAIFSLIAVGTLSVMNQGSGVAQTALEITQVRAQIDSQAETLRYLNLSFIANHRPGDAIIGSYSEAEYPEVRQWLTIRNDLTSATEQLTSSDVHGNIDSTGAVVCPTANGRLSNKNFVLNTKLAKVFVNNVAAASKFKDADTFAKVNYVGDNIDRVDGLWIEAIGGASTINQNAYIDFNIWACWYVPGRVVPATLSTKVRLYDPY